MGPNDYVHSNPPFRVRWGPGAVGRLEVALAACGSTRAMLVCGPSVRAAPAGLVDRAVAGSGGRIAEVFSGVAPHAPMETVNQARDRYVAAGCDAMVALGGSSSIDTMRAVAVALATGRDIEELFADRGRRLFTFEGNAHASPMIAVPTTFSSSEVTYGSGITSPAGQKYVCAGPGLYVDEIVLDPDAFAATPREILVTTGLCALNHALERSVSGQYQELAGAQLRTSAALLFEHLPTIAHGGIEDTEALRACIVGAHLSTSMQIMSGRTHAAVHVLGARYRVSHGALHGVLLPLIVHPPEVHDDQGRLDRLGSFCQPLGVGSPPPGSDGFTHLLRQFVGGLGAPTSLRQLGVPRADLPDIAAVAADDISAGPGAGGRDSVQEFLSLLQAAW